LGRKEDDSHVVVIGATNRPDSLDPALRRAGRFDREVCLGIPDKDARVQILQILCNKLKLAPDFSYEYVALNTPGFVGADLMALTREASMVAVNRFVYHGSVIMIVLLEYCYYRINFHYFFYFLN
jgi:ribosome biogenesis ATPase